MIEIQILPLGITEDICKSNLLAMEAMLAECDDKKKETFEEWRQRLFDDFLSQGFNPCPVCKSVPYVRWSLAGQYEWMAVISLTQSCCESHKPDEVSFKNIDTLDKAVRMWNDLIDKLA